MCLNKFRKLNLNLFPHSFVYNSIGFGSLTTPYTNPFPAHGTCQIWFFNTTLNEKTMELLSLLNLNKCKSQ
jgi:hypothetical protein